jgi:hypothetical protein
MFPASRVCKRTVRAAPRTCRLGRAGRFPAQPERTCLRRTARSSSARLHLERFPPGSRCTSSLQSRPRMFPRGTKDTSSDRSGSVRYLGRKGCTAVVPYSRRSPESTAAHKKKAAKGIGGQSARPLSRSISARSPRSDSRHCFMSARTKTARASPFKLTRRGTSRQATFFALASDGSDGALPCG